MDGFTCIHPFSIPYIIGEQGFLHLSDALPLFLLLPLLIDLLKVNQVTDISSEQVCIHKNIPCSSLSLCSHSSAGPGSTSEITLNLHLQRKSSLTG